MTSSDEYSIGYFDCSSHSSIVLSIFRMSWLYINTVVFKLDLFFDVSCTIGVSVLFQHEQLTWRRNRCCPECVPKGGKHLLAN